MPRKTQAEKMSGNFSLLCSAIFVVTLLILEGVLPNPFEVPKSSSVVDRANWSVGINEDSPQFHPRAETQCERDRQGICVDEPNPIDAILRNLRRG